MSPAEWSAALERLQRAAAARDADYVPLLAAGDQLRARLRDQAVVRAAWRAIEESDMFDAWRTAIESGEVP